MGTNRDANAEATGGLHSFLAGLLLGRRVLEVGCGSGKVTLEYAQAAARVDAIDIDGRALAGLDACLVAKGLEGRVTTHLRSLFDLEDEIRYDAALFTYSLHHLPVKRAIKKGFTLADRVIILDHGEGSEWAALTGESGRIRRVWKRVSNFPCLAKEVFETEIVFDDFSHLLRDISKKRMGKKNAKKYHDISPIRIRTPSRICEICQKLET
ncbi:MAG: hypothetical protein CVT48_06385 [Thermoplasmata archaeon HGW-Thermoplasmata-1]|nr:MAG: hypothetical protein CVT48_06385 [Thermoplasmata archaeon HGW-Thermoplasmata-1]